MNNIVEINNLHKEISRNTILNDINFNLEEGTIVGLLGANGAGKSTLMKIMCGLLKPSSGKVSIFGKVPFIEWRDMYREVGVLLEPNIPTYLKGKEFLKQLKILKGSKYDDINNLLKKVGLERAGDKKISNYSFGMKQRLGLAGALIGNPRLIILDEPFVGLDPLGIEDLQNILIDLAKSKVTIFISSHQLPELHPIVNRFLFLENGVITKDITDFDETLNLLQLFKKEAIQN